MRRRLWNPALFAVLAVLCLSSPFSAISSSEEENGGQAGRLVGAWRLVSVETIRPNGEIIYPFYGKHPEGLLIYNRSGWMSVQIVSDPQPSRPMTDSREKFLTAPSAEKVSAIDGYYAYYGTWTMDPTGTSVTYHIRQSLYPGERGENGTRSLSLQGDRLTLVAKPMKWAKITSENWPGNESCRVVDAEMQAGRSHVPVNSLRVSVGF